MSCSRVRCDATAASCHNARVLRRGLIALATVAAALALLAAQTATSISSGELLAGLSNPSRWLLHSGDYGSTRHSPLTQITPANVAKLTPAWTFDTGLGFGRQAK